MFHWTPAGAQTLLLTDTRTLGDATRDARRQPEAGFQTVLAHWWPGKEVWNINWRDVARACLFEFGQEVGKADRVKARAELTTYLTAHKFKTILVLQSRSRSARLTYDDDYAEASHTGSVCWDFFGPPANLSEMAGTFWGTAHGTVVALQNPQNVDYVYGAILMRTLRAVREGMPVFLPPAETTWTETGTGTRTGTPLYVGLGKILKAAHQGVPVAIDIESFSTQDLITVIGLSDGEHTCAVPWESFVPHGQSYREPGCHLSFERPLVTRILATARTVILHNGIRFDIPFLERKGLQVSGNVFDTYLAHGVLYNQFRHGLQAAVSYEFPIPPWKTFHTAAASRNGMDKDDAEAWIQDPKELRTYNASDVFYTLWLGQRLANYGGIRL